MPDNLVGTVTLNSFSSGIPTKDPALGVHHEDGVVWNSVKKQAVSFFAFLKGVFSEPATFLHLREMCFGQLLELSLAAG
jgi:hypothetical protein